MLNERLTPLDAVGEAVFAEDLVAELGLRERVPGRAYVVAAMIASADGRAALSGRSTGLGHPADRALLRALRAGVDAVLVGTGTIRAERYANLLDQGPRAARQEAGRPPLPLIATVTRGGDVPWDVGLFGDPEAEVAVFTSAPLRPPPTAARVTVLHRDELSLAGLLAQLHGEFGARAVLCEGGPTLLRELVAADLLDELLLTIAPLLAAGDAPAPLAGAPLEPPPALELERVLRADGHVILDYRRPR